MAHLEIADLPPNPSLVEVYFVSPARGGAGQGGGRRLVVAPKTARCEHERRALDRARLQDHR